MTPGRCAADSHGHGRRRADAPQGVGKGGTAMALRYGRADARFTQDLGAARIHPLTDFIDEFEAALGHGGGGFTGRVVDRKPPRPQGIRVDRRPHHEDRRSVSALGAGPMTSKDPAAAFPQIKAWFPA